MVVFMAMLISFSGDSRGGGGCDCRPLLFLTLVAGFISGGKGIVDLVVRHEELEEGHGGGEDEFGVGFIDGVDEGDEAAGEIAAVVCHSGHVCDDEGVVGACELEVVRRPCCAAEEFVKREAGGVTACLGDLDGPTPDLELGRVGRVGLEVAKEAEPFVGVADGGFVERVVVDA